MNPSSCLRPSVGACCLLGNCELCSFSGWSRNLSSVPDLLNLLGRQLHPLPLLLLPLLPRLLPLGLPSRILLGHLDVQVVELIGLAAVNIEPPVADKLCLAEEEGGVWIGLTWLKIVPLGQRKSNLVNTPSPTGEQTW